MFHAKRKSSSILSLFLVVIITAGLLLGCGKAEEPETEAATQQPTTEEVTTSADYVPTVTAMGITVPQYLKDTWISLYDCIYFAGPYVTQDGSWEWIDAADTTPKRGDLVVYIAASDPDIASHEAICVKSYDNGVYMNIDGNYGDEPGGLWKGRYDSGVPNKSWPDSYPKYPGTETAIGVYRTKNADDAELMAQAAEAVYDEYNIVGQDTFLKKYMPDFYHGVWCYYLIPIAVNAVARHKVELKKENVPTTGTLTETETTSVK